MLNFLNECFDCETWFEGFSKKELVGIVVKAIIAGAFLFSVQLIQAASIQTTLIMMKIDHILFILL